MKRIVYFIALFTTALLLTGCVTTKRKGDDLSWLGKAYHNTTALYNGYFNANEIMELTNAALVTKHQDNFYKVLPVYVSLAIDNPQANYAEMDRAIKKVSTVVALHRKSHWADDCYLLAGKAQYLKHDFESAEQTLRFLVNEYDPDKKAKLRRAKQGGAPGEKKAYRDMTPRERARAAKERAQARKKKAKEAERKRKEKSKEIARRKKLAKKGKPAPKSAAGSAKPGTAATPPPPPQKTKRQLREEKKAAEAAAKAALPPKPSKYFLKHRPCYQEGVLWLALTLIERDNFDGALRLLNELNQNTGTFSDIRAQLAPAYAHLFIRRKAYDDAIQPLKVAIETGETRRDRARYAYILAQLHQSAGRWTDAYAAFEQVVDLSANYDMAFNARLNLAQNAWLSGKSSPETAIRDLEKLSKDEKNAEFKDRIFFAMAQIALKNNDRPQAIVYLQQSAKANRANTAQLVETYYLLANLFQEDEDFVATKNYLDSTLTAMNKQDERFAATEKLRNNLKEVAELIQNIAQQDSILRLSKLTDRELRQRAEEIKKKQDQERLAQMSASTSGGGNDPGALPVLQRPGVSTTIFWAYNERDLRRGQREFARIWGDRPLADNWRRASRGNANAANSSAPLASNNNDAPLKTEEGDNLVETVLGKVPRSPDERRVLEIKLSELYYRLGVLYRERLSNNPKTIATLNTLDTRFPRSNYELNAWFYLYLAHTDLQQPDQAKVYFDRIVNRYPSSEFAKVLKDPNYSQQLASAKQDLNAFYDQAFAFFQQKNYGMAFALAQESKTKFGADNALAPRFALLGAMAQGNLQGPEAYKTALQEITFRYPRAEEGLRAKEILRLLGGSSANLPGDTERQTEPVASTQPEVPPGPKFTLEESVPHYVMVLLAPEASLEAAKNGVSDYHRKFYSLERLSITPVVLDPNGGASLLLIRRFSDAAAAMKYFEGAQKNPQEFLAGQKHQLFAISLNNYREVLSAKSLGNYDAFFAANYLD